MIAIRMNDTTQDRIREHVYTISGRNATACQIRTAAVDDINTIFVRLANQFDLGDNEISQISAVEFD